VANAIKFTPAGGRISIMPEMSFDGSFKIRIADTGIGMDPEGIAVALKPFGQVKSEIKSESEGTGLGLPLSVALMEMHGGSLTIESQPGAGTAVTLRFPKDRVTGTGNPRAPMIAAQ
jgi:signal transduction histidine kinase